MTDTVVHLSGAALPRGGFAAPLRHSLGRATIAQSTRRTLDELPDNLLRDLGLERDDIPFVAPELAFADDDPSRNALRRAVAPRPLSRVVVSLAVVAVAAVLTFAMLSRAVLAQDAPAGCDKYLSGKVIPANGQLV